jgi:hypothetical protein
MTYDATPEGKGHKKGRGGHSHHPPHHQDPAPPPLDPPSTQSHATFSDGAEAPKVIDPNSPPNTIPPPAQRRPRPRGHHKGHHKPRS